MSVVEYISNKFPISQDEYNLLDKGFGNLINYAAWQLLKKNSKNNHTHELEDITQELKIAMISAGSYYKRQLYIEECFKVLKEHVTDRYVILILKELSSLWDNRKRHGASKQKFGSFHEKLLDSIVNYFVPEADKPCRNPFLELDERFSRYCKNIAWNAQRTMGKKITKEKHLRSGLCSLSEYDFLAEVE